MPDKAHVRVLVVDDTTIVRAIVRRILEGDERFVVVGEAANGREAIELAGAVQPDLVLLDLAMPEMDGLEALPHLRRLDPSPEVIVLSAFSPDQMATAAIAAGASSYLEKSQLASKLIPHILASLQGVVLARS